MREAGKKFLERLMAGNLLARTGARMSRETRDLRSRILKSIFQLPHYTGDEIQRQYASFAEPILDDICLPPYFAETSHNDYLPLMKVATSLKPKIIVELGTAHGNTVANLCRQFPGVRVYTVNARASEQSGDKITFSLTSEEIGRVYRKHGYSDRVVQIYANTLELDLAEFLPGPVADLAIVDACHDESYVINDFHKVRPFIRPRGVVLLHDTHPSMAKHLAGSYVACMQLRRKGYDVRHIPHTWWGIWINDPSPQRLERRIAPSSQEAESR